VRLGTNTIHIRLGSKVTYMWQWRPEGGGGGVETQATCGGEIQRLVSMMRMPPVFVHYYWELSLISQSLSRLSSLLLGRIVISTWPKYIYIYIYIYIYARRHHLDKSKQQRYRTLRYIIKHVTVLPHRCYVTTRLLFSFLGRRNSGVSGLHGIRTNRLQNIRSLLTETITWDIRIKYVRS
jgi:hypothetical protein